MILIIYITIYDIHPSKCVKKEQKGELICFGGALKTFV